MALQLSITNVKIGTVAKILGIWGRNPNDGLFFCLESEGGIRVTEHLKVPWFDNKIACSSKGDNIQQ